MRSISEFGRQLLVPSGLMLVCGTAALRLGLLPSASADSLQMVVFAIAAASLALAWRFHLPRVALALVLIGLVTVGVVACIPITDDRLRCALALMAVAVPVNLAFLLLIDDAAFDLESLGWWAGVVAVESLLVYALARSGANAIANWFHTPLAAQGWGSWVSPAYVISGICIAALLVNVAVTRRSSDVGLFWAGVACFLVFATHTVQPDYLVFAVLVLGAGVVETSYTVAFHDELTGLPARRAFNRMLERLGESYTIAVVDIDHFKKFNDTYGHDVGDQVLRMVASRLARVTGRGKAFRCGGEEFAIVFPNTCLSEAYDHLELLREDIELTPFIVRGPDRSTRKRPERRAHFDRRRAREAGLSTTVTVSIGLAEPGKHAAPEDVMQWADRALYEAKDNGRNQVVCYVHARNPRQASAPADRKAPTISAPSRASRFR
ncbi:MAG TPA: GGDEF domain-containing protein [Clostridia bacterium]|nr:GGDEF domain-containing protein [Clostridia bacterium]